MSDGTRRAAELRRQADEANAEAIKLGKFARKQPRGSAAAFVYGRAADACRLRDRLLAEAIAVENEVTDYAI